MNTEIDLMAPRYKVIADYPNRPITMPIGHILTLNKWGAGKWWHEYTDDEPIHIDEGSTRFPVVLQPLPWYAEREESQMPEYVKQVNKNVVFKLLNSSQNGRRHHDNNEMELAHLLRYGEYYLPATKEEFEDYQTFKN